MAHAGRTRIPTHLFCFVWLTPSQVFNSRRSAHIEDVRTSERNWDLLVADENYKASRCRRCPQCNRVIERIGECAFHHWLVRGGGRGLRGSCVITTDGCDTMVCGQNAHGGNIQNGCGFGFNWNEAGPYSADIGKREEIKQFAEIPPSEISRVKHQIVEGQFIKCDICQANIQVLFRSEPYESHDHARTHSRRAGAV
jgi:ribosomal protein L34E